MELLWYGENLTASSTPEGSVNLFNTGTTATVGLTGNDLSINFGANGITSLLTETGVSGTGSPTRTFGDGWYALGIDPTGNPSNGQVFWVTFFRLLGDTNGDGVVTGPYTTAGHGCLHRLPRRRAIGLAAECGCERRRGRQHARTSPRRSRPRATRSARRAAGRTSRSSSCSPVPRRRRGTPSRSRRRRCKPCCPRRSPPGKRRAWMRPTCGGSRACRSQVGNLGTSILGLEAAGVITINQTAAGYNWYVARPVEPGIRPDGPGGEASRAGSPAADVDLLTVLEHELGHVIGLADNAQAGDLMDITLGLGVRRSPTAGRSGDDRRGFEHHGSGPAGRRSVQATIGSIGSVSGATVDAALASIAGADAGNGDAPGPEPCRPLRRDRSSPSPSGSDVEEENGVPTSLVRIRIA